MRTLARNAFSTLLVFCALVAPRCALAAPNQVPSGLSWCTGSDLRFTVNWPVQGEIRPQTVGFGPQRIAFKITVPTVFSPALNIYSTGLFRITAAPGAPDVAREVTVSLHACDFDTHTTLFNDIGLGDKTPSLRFTVANPGGFGSAGADFNLTPGDTYYVNVRNAYNAVPTCSGATCDIVFDFATPNRIVVFELPAKVPTLDPLAVIAIALLIAFLAAYRIRRRA